MPMLDLKLEVGPLHRAKMLTSSALTKVLLQPQHHHVPLLDGDGHCALCFGEPERASAEVLELAEA